MIARHGGEPWTAEQDEHLRLACVALAEQLGRTWLAVRARIDRLENTNYHVKWPENPAAPTSFQVLQDPASAYMFACQQLGGETTAMSTAAQIFGPIGIPHAHGVLILEQIAKKGWALIQEKGKNQRVITMLAGGPDEPGLRGRR